METKTDREQFEEIFRTYIKREGASALLDWICRTDFFTAPASAKYHLSVEGGLCKHSLNVYRRLLKLAQEEYGEQWENKISHESIALCGLLHDLCKVDYYKQDLRNVKKDGRWEQVPYYTIEEKLPYGHGEKSVYIINGFLRLTREEALAINWHMGGFDDRVRAGSRSTSIVYSQYPLSILLHLADLKATFLDEPLGE